MLAIRCHGNSRLQALGTGITGSQIVLGIVNDRLSHACRRLLLLGTYAGVCLSIGILQVPGAVANETQAAMWLMLCQSPTGTRRSHGFDPPPARRATHTLRLGNPTSVAAALPCPCSYR